jgi:hypothetical protein
VYEALSYFEYLPQRKEKKGSQKAKRNELISSPELQKARRQRGQRQGAKEGRRARVGGQAKEGRRADRGQRQERKRVEGQGSQAK